MRARREAAGGPVNCGLTNESPPTLPVTIERALKRVFMRVFAGLRP
jgi:hypothetical protein